MNENNALPPHESGGAGRGGRDEPPSREIQDTFTKKPGDGENKAECAFKGDGQEGADKALLEAQEGQYSDFYKALARELVRHEKRGGNLDEFWRQYPTIEGHFTVPPHSAFSPLNLELAKLYEAEGMTRAARELELQRYRELGVKPSIDWFFPNRAA